MRERAWDTLGRAGVIAAATLLTCCVGVAPAASDGKPGGVDGYLQDDVAQVWNEAAEDTMRSDLGGGANDGAASLVQYQRGRQCNVGNATPITELTAPCPDADGYVDPPLCGDGVAHLEALWRRNRDAPTSISWEPWTFVAPAICPQDVLPEFTAEDFRRLPLTPSPVTPQPPNPHLLTGLGLVVHTTADPQDHPTTLLGFPLTVRATPTEYTWDFGDGTRTTTTHPGTPYPTGHDHHPGDPVYPHGVIGHPYPHLGTYTPTLTTTWTGQYLLAGTTDWRPIDGTATTTTALPTVTIHDATSHLVADNCHTNPHGPGC
ncbi:hypothetical protein AB6N24_05610 [Cellulomonas sp. 179-A 4D5 NHS]|uniref:hypothetical protein n=1 Tax=Cellulomonas sp. 179-A 4D5 NHS TaxID=3142378 RepID=UPI0039A2004A